MKIRSALCFLSLLSCLQVPGLVRAADLLVCSRDNSSVIRFDGDTGAFIDTFIGSHSGGLNYPHGIVIGPDSNVYICGQLNYAVLRFDGINGAFIDRFASGEGLGEAFGLAFGPNGNLYVCAAFEGDIYEFDGRTGAFIRIFVPQGTGGMSNCRSLVFGPDGNLYACNVAPVGIKRFNGTTGAYLGDFTSGFALPGCDGLTFGPDTNLYVSAEGNTVYRFNGQTGVFINQFVSPGDGGLRRARGIAFGPDGNLYVVDTDNNRVLRYHGGTGAFMGAFASGGGLASPTFLAFLLNFATLHPSAYELIRGHYVAGGLQDLVESDDSYLFIGAQYPLPVAGPQAQVAFEATAPEGNILQLQFSVEAATVVRDIRQRIDLYDFAANMWVNLDDRTATTNDSVAQISVTQNAGRYVQDNTRIMRARIGWTQRTVPFPNWMARLDQVSWRIGAR